ncbi:ead/Ea22-like family protein [Enterobacter kobei]|uniref:ead/Ea22-like family protein n=1 Tax=Enterobacter kobei TaxID=208224 RepID=UPI002FD6EC1E
MTFKKLTQAEKNKIRRKAMEAITDENYGDDGDNFHEHATAQAVISLLDELELKTEQRANWCAMAKKLGEDLDAAEKRVAELEAREVTLPEDVTSANAPEVFEITAEAERLGLRGTYASYAVGWNARGMADKEALRAARICINGEN